MRVVLIIILSLYVFQSNTQYVSFEEEKEIIRTTLSQYLDSNPNSLASYIKGNKGYEMMEFGLKMGLAFEKDSTKKSLIIQQYDSLNYFSDSIITLLKNKKIEVIFSDTIFAYDYTPGYSDLRKEADWQNNYSDLLFDFEENGSARLDTIIGSDYIDLIRRQILYEGDDHKIRLSDLDHAYYQYKTSSNDEAAILGIKIYRAVFNDALTKGCYLISFVCRGGKSCRSFIFIKKEENNWIFVDDYPSWLVDEA